VETFPREKGVVRLEEMSFNVGIVGTVALIEGKPRQGKGVKPKTGGEG